MTTQVQTGRSPYTFTTLNLITASFMVAFHVLAIAAFFFFSWTNLLVALVLHWFAVGFGISLGTTGCTRIEGSRRRRRSSTSSRCAAR